MTGQPTSPSIFTATDDDEREHVVHMGAYSWIQRLPTRRGSTTLAEADKPLLMHLWSFAPFRLRGDASATQVHPSRERLVSDTGATLTATIKRLARLTAAGWIRRRGRGWDLAWRVPFTARAAIPQRIEEAPEEGPGPIPQGIEGSPPRSLKGSDKTPQGIDMITPDQTKGEDQTNHTDHVGLAEPTPIAAGVESNRTRPARGHMSQQTLFGEATTAPSKPRDLAAEVFEYLRERIIATKTDLGIKPARGPSVLSPADRRNIEARIREQQTIAGRGDGLEAGLLACKQVIDVDEADCRRKGEVSQYWNATTPFRNASNFDARLGRWRENGEHQIFGTVEQRKPKPIRRDLGFHAAISPEDDAQLDYDLAHPAWMRDEGTG